MSDSQFISTDFSKKAHESFVKDRANKVARNAVVANNIFAVAQNSTALRSYHDSYSVQVPKKAEITNQRQSGRCWMFSAFNVARLETMKFLDVDTFEFSQVYGMFYDKLEKANSTLEYVLATLDKPWDDRIVQWNLEYNMGDGGYYNNAMSLIKKYGLVPKDAMPETAASKNSTDMEAVLTRLVRKAAFELREAHEQGAELAQLREKKEKALEEVYRVLAISLGEPPLSFDFVTKVGKKHKADASKVEAVTPKLPKDEDKKDTDKKDDDEAELILRDTNITPLEFAKRYVPFDPDAYISLVYMPGKARPEHSLYHLTYTDAVLGGIENRYFNVSAEVIDAAAIASLKAGVAVGMACDVMQNFPRKEGGYVLGTDTMDFNSLFNADFDMDRAAMLDVQETGLTHAMTFQGVELDAKGKPVAWKVENSWGKDSGKDGYLIMSADWFHTFGGEIDVRRDFVPQEILEAYDKAEVTDVAPWSNVARAFGRPRH